MFYKYLILNNFFYGLILALSFALSAPAAARDDGGARVTGLAMPEISRHRLPPEARDTLMLIERGGPFPYERDGIVFGNFEKRLPLKERGHYREYTVKTPGAKNRGARRIVAAGCSGGARKAKGEAPRHAPCTTGERYYTDDHYKSFKRVVP